MNSYQINHVHLDFEEQKISSKGNEINVDQKAFEVLKIMIEHQNKVVKSETFMQKVWGDKPSSQEVVPAAISRLRKLFKMAGIHEELIVTVHKVGYKFVPPENMPNNNDPVTNKKFRMLWSSLAVCLLLLMVSLIYIWLNINQTQYWHNDKSSEKITLKKESSSTQTQIYILRHTEKIDNSEDPPLSEAGKKRAAYWRTVLKYIDFDRVYTTHFERNRQTAEIITQELGVKTELYYPMSFDVVDFIAQVKGQNILIIGHSNTIPDMVNRLLGESTYPPMSHKDYNQLMLITINQNGDTSSSVLHIEAPQ